MDIQFPTRSAQSPAQAPVAAQVASPAQPPTDPISPLLKQLQALPADEQAWQVQRWTDKLQSLPPTEAEALVNTLVTRIDALETQPGGVPKPSQAEYRQLLNLYNAFSPVLDRFKTAPPPAIPRQGSAQPTLPLLD